MNPFDAGEVELSDEAEFELTVKTDEVNHTALMDIRSIRLIRLPD
ncbi:hypothetical protein OT109_01530 [Phycisphaeraceae bacterium D3-23]